MKLHEAVIGPSELEGQMPELGLGWTVDARVGGNRVVDYRHRSGDGADEPLDHVTPPMSNEGGLRQLPTAQVQSLVPSQVDVLRMLARLARGEV